MSKKLDLKAFASTVDQIWAEALAKYNADPKRDLILSEEAALLAEKAQASKEDTHEWLGRIQDVLELPAPIDRYKKSFCSDFDSDTDRVELRTKVCLEEICESLGLDINRMSEGQKRTIKSCMKGLEHLGWQFAGKAISFGKYGKQRGWINVSNSTF
jgi:predicted P-loop ATPase